MRRLCNTQEDAHHLPPLLSSPQPMAPPPSPGHTSFKSVAQYFCSVSADWYSCEAVAPRDEECRWMRVVWCSRVGRVEEERGTGCRKGDAWVNSEAGPARKGAGRSAVALKVGSEPAAAAAVEADMAVSLRIKLLWPMAVETTTVVAAATAAKGSSAVAAEEEGGLSSLVPLPWWCSSSSRRKPLPAVRSAASHSAGSSGPT